jgi:transposase
MNRMTYSYDLRTKALDYIENGGSQAKASQIFGVTTRTLLNWINRKKDGILPPSKRQRDPYKIEDEKLKSYIQEHPDSFLREISEAFKVSIAAVFYACKRLKITLKKRHHSTKKGMNQKEKSFKKS